MDHPTRDTIRTWIRKIHELEDAETQVAQLAAIADGLLTRLAGVEEVVEGLDSRVRALDGGLIGGDVTREELVDALLEAEAGLKIAVSVISQAVPEADWSDSSPRKALREVRDTLGLRAES